MATFPVVGIRLALGRGPTMTRGRFSSGIHTEHTNLLCTHALPAIRSRGFASTPSAASSSASSSVASEGLAEQVSTATTSWVAPWIPYVDALPSYLGLEGTPYAYTASIVLATIFLRTSVTLPVALWQRRRTRRLAEVAVPEWERRRTELPSEVATRCRAQRLPHNVYKEELKRTMRQEMNAILKKHRCSPTLSLVMPIAINVPLFITVSYIIRTALWTKGMGIGNEVMPWWSPPAELMAQYRESANLLVARGLEGDAVKLLTTMQGPTLADRDQSMVAPIGLGMLSLINVELGQWIRKPLLDGPDGDKGNDAPAKSPSTPLTAEEKRAGLVRLRSVVIGNLLRAASIAFVVIASQSPVGLAIYWLSSAAYTLVQNAFFAASDRKRNLAKATTARAAQGRARARK